MTEQPGPVVAQTMEFLRNRRVYLVPKITDWSVTSLWHFDVEGCTTRDPSSLSLIGGIGSLLLKKLPLSSFNIYTYVAYEFCFCGWRRGP